MQIGADVALKIAQAKNIQAQTKKLEGVDTKEARTRIDDLLQGITNKKSDKRRTSARMGEIKQSARPNRYRETQERYK